MANLVHGLIATCYHVVKSIVKYAFATGKKKYVSISFSGEGNNKIDAEVLERYCTTNPDVAILKIDKVPPGQQAAKLGKHLEYYVGHRFESSGYRKNDRFSSPLSSNGRILSDPYSKEHSSKVVRLETTNYGEVDMSGSAVLDVDEKLKIPLVVRMMFHDEDEKGVDHKAPYAIAVSDIIRTCPEIEKTTVVFWSMSF
jgi:hypothetical protein